MSKRKANLMDAVQWTGVSHKVTVRQIPKPTITHPLDAVVRLTSAGICGTELHLYRGRWPNAKPPLTLGHEMVGIVDKVGSGVTNLKVGDRVLVYDSASCGFCDNCTRGLRAYCQTLNPPFENEFFGIPFQGIQLDGGQAQFVRVPYAEQGTLLLPKGTEHELDYLLLSDVWPTAWTCLDFAEFQPGDIVAIFGAGPVGLLCAYSALLRGASKVYSIDRIGARLATARSIGAIPIDFSKSDPVAQILKLEPLGVDRACDCVGFECEDETGLNVPNEVISNAIQIVQSCGGIGVVGPYIVGDPGAPTEQTKKGILEIPFAMMMFKRISIKSGAVTPHVHHEAMKKLIESGKANLDFVWGKEIGIHDAPETYREFSSREILKPVIRF